MNNENVVLPEMINTDEKINNLKDEFAEKGYVILKNFLNDEEITALRNAAIEIIEETADPESIFTTKNQCGKTNNDFFFQSANNISLFWEEDAFDEEGNLKQDRKKSINKFGHATHDLNPVFREFVHQKKLEIIAKRVINFEDPVIIQSMYIYKQPKIGGEVTPHQDSTFLYTEPLSCRAFWFALEDATTENGCLYVIPSSYKSKVYQRFHVAENGKDTTFEKFCTDEEIEEIKSEFWDETKAITVEVPAGSLVMFDGSLVHFSKSNTSNKSREAFTIHMIERSSNWPSDNWLQRDEDFPFKGYE
eukprot:TRINITY_DN2215_c2_g2_i2.p1 TRINITY_DN2215_c2_g2~~TRINITY_DN2215_c2_g2_i2.p1  ORF type:complete len:305 (+),score=103.59 TRINITY_DN2215_c2_g2_i2:51-965(+)